MSTTPTKITPRIAEKLELLKAHITKVFGAQCAARAVATAEYQAEERPDGSIYFGTQQMAWTDDSWYWEPESVVPRTTSCSDLQLWPAEGGGRWRFYCRSIGD